MKKIIKDKELREKILEAIDLLCNAVKTTLGPKGKNVIINTSSLSPFITNDGVTIAENIESEDPILNTILDLAKESSIKTNEMVGDGTTTTLVLLQSLIKEGYKKIEEGYSPLTLKKEMNKFSYDLIEFLKQQSISPTKNEMQHIASTAANDLEIGKIISNLYLKLNQNGSIKIEESLTEKTYTKILNGYSLDTGIVSDLFLENKKELNLKNSYVLLCLGCLSDLEQIAEIINYCQKHKESLTIFADDYSDEFIQNCIIYNYQNEAKIVLIKNPDFASRKKAILTDLSFLTEATLVDLNISPIIQSTDLGIVQNIQIDLESTLLLNDQKNEKLENYIKNLKLELMNCFETYEQEFLRNRIAKLTSGLGFIYVGALTKTERREKKMRYDDALCAIETAQEGILLGGGISLLEAKEELNFKSVGSKIIQNSLDKPFIQIMQNLDLNEKEILEQIKKTQYKSLYNPLTNQYENINTTSVIDSFLVIKNALLNAISIAGMLLTTSCLVINQSEINQIAKEDIL